jgi:hypothetical protein
MPWPAEPKTPQLNKETKASKNKCKPKNSVALPTSANRGSFVTDCDALGWYNGAPLALRFE